MERTEQKTIFQWNLDDLYPSQKAWEEEKEIVMKDFSKIVTYKGKLEDTNTLLECLEFVSKLQKEMNRLVSYAMMKSDEDIRISQNRSMKQELMQASSNLSSCTSFIEPEILAMGEQTLKTMTGSNAEFDKYKMYIEDLFRKKKHTLSENEERILAHAGLILSGPYSIYSVFTNAELPYPEVELSNGTKAFLDSTGYSQYRAFPNRKDRKLVFDAFWTKMSEFKGTIGEQLYHGMKSNVFEARSRNYGSSVERALDQFNIPIQVYSTLIKNVHANLGSFHRYLNLRKRLLKVDKLKYYDLYAPVVKDIDISWSYREAQQLVIEAMYPLGKEYIRILQRAFDERWIDVYPSKGKRSGAYSNGSAYDVHPYILLNYNEKFNDVSTLAHELGHTMHSFLSNKNQPFQTADYSIFVAEVASTFNEVLLFHKMLDTIDNDRTKLSLLMNHLDGFKGTLFRQTQFAEFELECHKSIESGKPLSGDEFTNLYGSIIKKYYGHSEGICDIDELYFHEWEFIPHFYYNFYVYQYATSYTASIALSEKVLNNEPGIVNKYLTFLSSGNSKYPIDLLKIAGVDMTSHDPFIKAMESMNQIMDEVENLLDKMEL